MVSPTTNCSPSTRIARSIAARISGSPPRRSTRSSAPGSPPCSPRPLPCSRPVISRPQVAAFTNSDSLCPRCAAQSPLPILSRISRSRVAGSGTRSSASARHIRATPSWLDRAYSRIRPSTGPGRPRARSASTSRVVRRVAEAGVNGAMRSSSATQAGSGRLVSAVMRRRVSERARQAGAKAPTWAGAASRSARSSCIASIPSIPAVSRVRP